MWTNIIPLTQKRSVNSQNQTHAQPTAVYFLVLEVSCVELTLSIGRVYSE